MTLLVALCGTDGTGKSKHTAALAAALRAQGIDAHPWCHTRPSHDAAGDPWRTGLHYASQRARLASDIAAGIERADVLVCDRWLWSAYVTATTQHRKGAMHGALWDLLRAERGVLPPVSVILLDAPRLVIEARLRARPEPVPPTLAAALAEYADLALYHGWPVVSTDRDAAEVTRELVAIVRGMLAAAAAGGAR